MVARFQVVFRNPLSQLGMPVLHGLRQLIIFIERLINLGMAFALRLGPVWGCRKPDLCVLDYDMRYWLGFINQRLKLLILNLSRHWHIVKLLQKKAVKESLKKVTSDDSTRQKNAKKRPGSRSALVV